MAMSIRPAGNAAAKLYSPERDLAYLFPALVREVFAALDASNWTAWQKAFFEQYAISEDDMGDTAKAFGDSLRLFLRNPNVDTIEIAMDRGGFAHRPAAEQAAFYEAVGASMVAGFFVCAKEATTIGQISPLHTEYVGAIAAATDAWRRLRGITVTHTAERELVYETAFEEVLQLKAIIRQQNDELTLYRSKGLPTQTCCSVLSGEQSNS